MRVSLVLLMLLAVCAGMIAGGSQAYAQYDANEQDYGRYGYYGDDYARPYPPMGLSLGDRELRNLVAPIALYPDSLIAIILPASTYVDDIIEANRRNLAGNELAIQRQPWDISVKSLAHYPGVLRMLARDPDWTAALGQAYVYQPADLMDAIQYLRKRAWDNGVLRSNRYQRVIRDGGYILIVPAQTDYVYVPQYDPDVVYLSRKPNYGPHLLSFGLGLLIGSWLDNDTDWNRHRIFRHRWDNRDWMKNWNRRHRIDRNDYYFRNWNVSIIGNHDIIRRRVNFGRLRTYRLPGVVGGPALRYPRSDDRDRDQDRDRDRDRDADRDRNRDGDRDRDRDRNRGDSYD